MMRKLKKMILVILIVIGVVLISSTIFFSQKKFGRTPSGQRLERIEKSPNYSEGTFRNINIAPQIIGKNSRLSLLKKTFIDKHIGRTPTDIIPSIKRDLKSIQKGDNIFVWLGHSSIYMQVDGKKIAVDPVLSGLASPLPIIGKAFKGTDPYSYSDFPELDYLIITHDHWDHLDYETIKHLKFKNIVCPLGVAEHFERWGYKNDIIYEGDWGDIFNLDGLVITLAPSHHFSGRTFDGNKTLWSSYILEMPNIRIFISGDGGYDTTFKELGDKYGEFDLAILECGQYNEMWKYIHMSPEQTLMAAKDLRAKMIMPVHNSKFALAHHSWNEPLERVTEFNKTENLNVVTPIIGEIVHISDTTQHFSEWWRF